MVIFHSCIWSGEESVLALRNHAQMAICVCLDFERTKYGKWKDMWLVLFRLRNAT